MNTISYASPEDLAEWAAEVMERAPDFVIGAPAYLRRWWIIPRNEQQNVYLHEILRDDDDRALHDHPWDNQSLVLRGSYREITPEGTFIRKAGDLITRSADTLHRLELIDGAPCISLFFTGPKVREWGFACPKGWVHWRDFTAGTNGELVGRGCGEHEVPPRTAGVSRDVLEPLPGNLPSAGQDGAATHQFASYGDAESFWRRVESVSVHTNAGAA